MAGALVLLGACPDLGQEDDIVVTGRGGLREATPGCSATTATPGRDRREGSSGPPLTATLGEEPMVPDRVGRKGGQLSVCATASRESGSTRHTGLAANRRTHARSVLDGETLGSRGFRHPTAGKARVQPDVAKQHGDA